MNNRKIRTQAEYGGRAPGRSMSGAAGRIRAFALAMGMFASVVAGLAAAPGVAALTDIPDSIVLSPGVSKTYSVGLPIEASLTDGAADVVSVSHDDALGGGAYRLSGDVTLSTGSSDGSATVDISLFGIVPVKTVSVTVRSERYVIPGGQSIGVLLHTKGALVVGGSDIVTESGVSVNPARDAGLLSGDVITHAAGTLVRDSEQLASIINSRAGQDVTLTVLRGGEELELTLSPVRDRTDGQYRLGVWVRDSTAGVGTLTMYDPATEMFAGLGHAITDADTGSLLEVRQGEIVLSGIVDISKGESGEPGELLGSFDQRRGRLGSVAKNTEYGLYGHAYAPMENPIYGAVPVANRSEVREGDATLLTTVSDSGIEEFACRIAKVNAQNTPEQKSFVVEITDDRLLRATGGIVQGMGVRYNKDNTGKPHHKGVSGARPCFH